MKFLIIFIKMGVYDFDKSKIYHNLKTETPNFLIIFKVIFINIGYIIHLIIILFIM